MKTWHLSLTLLLMVGGWTPNASASCQAVTSVLSESILGQQTMQRIYSVCTRAALFQLQCDEALKPKNSIAFNCQDLDLELQRYVVEAVNAIMPQRRLSPLTEPIENEKTNQKFLELSKLNNIDSDEAAGTLILLTDGLMKKWTNHFGALADFELRRYRAYANELAARNDARNTTESEALIIPTLAIYGSPMVVSGVSALAQSKASLITAKIAFPTQWLVKTKVLSSVPFVGTGLLFATSFIPVTQQLKIEYQLSKQPLGLQIPRVPIELIQFSHPRFGLLGSDYSGLKDDDRRALLESLSSATFSTALFLTTTGPQVIEMAKKLRTAKAVQKNASRIMNVVKFSGIGLVVGVATSLAMEEGFKRWDVRQRLRLFRDSVAAWEKTSFSANSKEHFATVSALDFIEAGYLQAAYDGVFPHIELFVSLQQMRGENVSQELVFLQESIARIGRDRILDEPRMSICWTAESMMSTESAGKDYSIEMDGLLEGMQSRYGYTVFKAGKKFVKGLDKYKDALGSLKAEFGKNTTPAMLLINERLGLIEVERLNIDTLNQSTERFNSLVAQSLDELRKQRSSWTEVYAELSCEKFYKLSEIFYE